MLPVPRRGAEGEKGLLWGRAWQAVAKEWLSVVAGQRGLRGLRGWRHLRRAVALQLLASDPSLQQAALKCLKVLPNLTVSL